MTPIPLGLASLLGAGGASLARTPAPAAPSEDFAELLRMAQAGEIESGRPVTAGPGVAIDLTEAQLARLAAAADRAEAAGVVTAAILIDGEALVVDVRARTITARLDMASGEPLRGIDAIISVPPDHARPLAAPATPLSSHPSLLEALARRSA